MRLWDIASRRAKWIRDMTIEDRIEKALREGDYKEYNRLIEERREETSRYFLRRELREKLVFSGVPYKMIPHVLEWILTGNPSTVGVVRRLRESEDCSVYLKPLSEYRQGDK